MIEFIENKINNAKSNYPLNLIQFISFLENSFGTENKFEVILEYMQNISVLIKMLPMFY